MSWLISHGRIALAVGLVASCQARGQRPEYAVEFLPTLGGPGHSVTSLNSHGHAAGMSTNADQQQRAVFWKDGELFDLGELKGSRNDLRYNAHSINDADRIVGTANLTSIGEPSRIWSWDPANGMQYLDLVGHFTAWVAGLANDGSFTYTLLLDDWSFYESYRWINGDSSRLPSPNGPDVRTTNMNSALTIVGFCGGQDKNKMKWWDDHAVVWPFGEEPIDLGTFGGRESRAYAINDQGEVVGKAQHADRSWHAFHWFDGQLTDLGEFGTHTTWAIDINNHGEIIGGGEFANGVRRPTIFRDNAFVDLNDLIDPDLGLTMTYVTEINDNAAIGGGGRLVDGTGVAVVLHRADIWLDQPVPARAGEVNAFSAHRIAANARVALAYGLERGDYEVPGCPGLVVNITSPRIAGVTRADANGLAQWNIVVPRGAAGRTIQFQVLEPGACRVSQRVPVQFE